MRLFSIYSPHYPAVLVAMLQRNKCRVGSYLREYWQTNDFARQPEEQTRQGQRTAWLLTVLWLGVIAQLVVGLLLIWLQFSDGLTGGLVFGLALVISYPVVWAHMLALFALLWWLLRPKALGRAIVCSILESQVKRLRRRHTFDVVAVVGSAGKTSTKIAIARVLQATRQVQWQEGNYNDRVTVPLVFFDHVQPNIFDIFAWIRVFWRNEAIIRRPYPYQVVVVELGTDGPGFIEEFAYIKPELAVVTAVAPTPPGN